MAVRKQVVITCDICPNNVTYTWRMDRWNVNAAMSRARENGWQIGKNRVYCPLHRTTKRRQEVDADATPTP